MKSFDKKNILSNSSVYSLLALYMPLSVIIAFTFILDSMAGGEIPEVLFLSTSVISALAASLYSVLMKDVKSGRTAANIRGGIIILVIFYIISSLYRSHLSWIDKFFPNMINISVSVCAVFIWNSVISLKQFFNARIRFEIITESFQGEQLKERLFSDPSLLLYNDEHIRKARYNYFFQLSVICIFTVICLIFNIHLPLSLYIFIIIMIAAAVCIYGFFEIINWEQYFASEGINLSAHDRSKRISAVIIIIIPGIIIALLLSSNKNLIPFSIITGFFTWFFSLFDRQYTVIDTAAGYDAFTNQVITPDLSVFEELPPSSPVLQTISKYGLLIIKYSLIILAAVFFIRFMISPLLNRGEKKEKIKISKNIFLIISEWFRGIIEAIVSFFANLKENNTMKLRKQNTDQINKTAEILFNVYSPVKKQDMRQSITLFARLIIWGGETRNVTWKPSHAPGEYCAILADAVYCGTAGCDAVIISHNGGIDLQKQNKNIIRCGAIFEKAIYSAEVLSDEERKEFNDLIEEITAVTPS